MESSATTNLIREARLRADLSQEELAWKAGVSVRTIARLEDAGDGSVPQRRTRRAVAEVLGIDPIELLEAA